MLYGLQRGINDVMPFDLSKSANAMFRELVLENPSLHRAQRKVLDWLQNHRPVLNLGPLIVVTGYEEVRQVLTCDDVFSVEKVYGERTERDNGPFVLSQDRGELHQREKALLEAVMPASDLPKIAALCDRWIKDSLQPYLSSGRFDLVQNYSRQIPYLLIKEYFGVPGPNDRALKSWISDIFADIFTNIFNRSELADKGEAAGQALTYYLAEYINQLEADLQRGIALPDTVLVRMIRYKGEHEWLNNDSIRRNISGLIVGSLETVSKSAINIMQELFQRPDISAEMKALIDNDSADKSTENSANQLDSLQGYLLELLRFRPHNPFLLRYTKSAYRFKSSSDIEDKARRFSIGKGRWVLVSTYAAHHDRRSVDHPERIDPKRELSYLHFGYGLHRCQGARVSVVLLSSMISALMKLEGLMPLCGVAGELQYSGTFPSQWNCEFKPVTNLSDG